MELQVLPVGALETNCYLVAAQSGNCVIIDPGAEPEKIEAFIRQKGWNPVNILLTHGHYDHIGGVKALQRSFPQCKLFVSVGDAEMLADAGKSLAAHRYANAEDYVIAGDVTQVREGDTIAVDELVFTVMETPGHTKGGVTYLCGEHMFSGDTLFRLEVGRADLYGGNFKVLQHSLSRMAALEGDYTVYPGHGPSSTLDYERAHNPYITAL